MDEREEGRKAGRLRKQEDSYEAGEFTCGKSSAVVPAPVLIPSL
jgi:hypothetical protein